MPKKGLIIAKVIKVGAGAFMTLAVFGSIFGAYLVLTGETNEKGKH